MSSLILGNKYIEVVNIYALTRFVCGDEDGACMLYWSVNNLEPVVLNTVCHVVGCLCPPPSLRLVAGKQTTPLGRPSFTIIT